MRLLPSNLNRLKRLGPRSGQSMIEFALSFLLFTAIVTGFAQLAMAVWIKTALHHCVREGSRYAITGSTQGGAGQVGSVKKVIKDNSAGLINDANVDSYVLVEFHDSAGAKVTGAGANAGGNTVVVGINNYPIPTLISPLLSWVPDALTVSAASVGRLEPYTTAPSL